MADSKKEKNELEKVFTDAMARFEHTWSVGDDQRTSEYEDQQFRAGEQWPLSVKSQRENEGRPIVTVNLMGQYIRQVTGDVRINRPSIKVRPAKVGASKETAKVFAGLIRHIEEDSDAQNAYVTAIDSSATCGIGHFRITTEYSDDDSFDQDIKIERILNPSSVYWDPAAIKLTKEDAKWCFVTERMMLEDFQAKYPGASTANFEENPHYEDVTNWWNGESVRVAEYWLKIPVQKKLALLQNGDTVELPERGLPPEVEKQIVRTRTVETHKVVRYVMNGTEILEGPGDWAGKYIPIIPVVGEEIFVGERTVRHGLVRFAKDPQRLYNYSRTAMAEGMALAPKAPWLLTPSQIEGFQAMWDSANRGNPPYLLYNPDPLPNVTPPKRIEPAPVSQAHLAEAEISQGDMRGVTGIHEASLGARGNETSGKAIALRQREGDTGSFVYTDNLSKSIKHAGRILVDLIPKVYDTERVIRVLGEDMAEDFIPINVPVEDDDGNIVLMNDLTVGKYDVKVITGPSYSTQRMEAADSMMSFVEAVPGAAAGIADLIAENMDWPGADKIASRLRKMLPPNLADQADEKDLSPEEQAARAAMREQEAAKQAQIEKLEMARAMAELKELTAKVDKMNSETQENLAKADEIEFGVAERALTMAIQNGQIAGIIQQQVQAAVMEIVSNRPTVNQPTE